MTLAGQTSTRSTGRSTVAQIDRVIAFKGTAREAAASVGVSRLSAEAWRKGELPTFYVEAKRVERQAQVQQRAARFYKPQDVRAGR